MKNYNIKDLETFNYVANLRSFAKASEVLNISRAVVTTRIIELEKILKMTLLTRTTRRVNLTSDGKKFLTFCKSILTEVENLDNFLNQNSGISGVLRMVLPPYFGRYYVAPYLKDFLAKYPNLELEITITDNLINIIDRGYDLQIRNSLPQEKDLKAEKLSDSKKIICATPEYIAMHSHIRTPEDLIKHNFFSLGKNNVLRLRNKITNRFSNIYDLNSNVKCGNVDMVKELVLSSAGVALQSLCYIEKEIKEKKLVTLLDDYEVVNKMTFYAVYPECKYRSPRLEAFINFLREIC